MTALNESDLALLTASGRRLGAYIKAQLGMKGIEVSTTTLKTYILPAIRRLDLDVEDVIRLAVEVHSSNVDGRPLGMLLMHVTPGAASVWKAEGVPLEWAARYVEGQRD